MSQAEQILDLLRARGRAGASNFELMRISYQYPARIHQLRHKEGCEIEVKHVKDKEWHIRLVKDADGLTGFTRPVKPDDLEPEPAVGTTEGDFIFKGNYSPVYEKGKTYTLKIAELTIGKPIVVLAPYHQTYSDLARFGRDWAAV